jgi:hypothetical protein
MPPPLTEFQFAVARALRGGRCPGVHQVFRRWRARFPFRCQWVYLGLYESETEANRVSAAARSLPVRDQARLARCRSAAVRRRLLPKLVQQMKAREAAARGSYVDRLDVSRVHFADVPANTRFQK